MTESASITRRLTLSVLLLEFLAAVVLIGLVTNHERRVEFESFDADLRATSNELLGAVQEADSKEGSIRLDLHNVTLSPRAIYSVTAENGQVLGARGELPPMPPVFPGSFFEDRVSGHPFRFYLLKGERVIDPGSPEAVNHEVTVVYGVPEGRTWHRIFEATRFFALATLGLLGITAFLLTWLIRRFLLPIHELANEAEKVNAERWIFHAPASSKRFVELRPLASAIEKTVARLQRSFEQQQRFTSDAAHELKTDLATVKSSVQLLGMRRRTVEEYERGLNLGLDDIARLETTIQKMLTLARLERGPKGDHQTCDLTAVVEDVVTQNQPFADIKQISVVSENLPAGIDVPLSQEDALLLCSNILVNALQHSPSLAVVTVTMLPGKDSVTLRFRDRGEGISEEDRPFLFDAFYRGDVSRSRRSGGTGLGLSICKAICDRAQGTISIANHPQGGAEVEICLPVISPNGSKT